MESPDSGAPLNTPAKKQRKRPVNACATCRARKVKCDERPNGCLNCERLQLDCVQNGKIASAIKTPGTAVEPIIGIKRKRTFRSCVPCRDAKVKCSGEKPKCTRCSQRRTSCLYDAEANEPAWVQNIAVSSSANTPDGVVASPQTPQTPPNHFTSLAIDPPIADCPPALNWLFASQLPPKPRLHALLDAYFNSVAPIRVFAFEHKPSFVRMLDEGQLTDTADQALLHIMCALGAKFYALEWSESFAPLSKCLIQSAGTQWAKYAETLFFNDYSTISITRLKVLILLHDQEARAGNYAGSFLLTGLVIRMAHALQLNNEVSADILCKEEGGSPTEASVRESRRRLMWACYMIDVWAGSGVDHLTILNEDDLKIQLPCNERQWQLQIPVVTERLQEGDIIDFICEEDIPEKPKENLGMAAFYVRIVSIWRRVLRFVKHLDEEQPLWLSGSQFAFLINDLQSWKQSLPKWLEFSADNIYIRRDTHQLGALLLIHCMYHHVMCDVHRIALPDLYKNQEPFAFPPGQEAFVAHLQSTCFDHAQLMSVLVSTILQHGVKHFADSILPSFVYNSSRIMLYYIARILDRSNPDAAAIINRTIELVQQNNKTLREMTLIYPLAESLCVTTERWLEQVRTSMARGHSTTYIAPQDPSENEARRVVGAPVSGAVTVRQSPPLSAMTPTGDGLQGSPTPSQIVTSGFGFSAPSPGQLSPSLAALPGLSARYTDVNSALYAATSGIEQPVFDLDDLQNFFQWGATGDENAQHTGFEGFGPLGWANNFSIM